MTLPPDFLSGEYSSAVAVWQTKLARAQSAKVESGLRPIAVQFIESAHDLFAKPLTLWRIMRYAAASLPQK